VPVQPKSVVYLRPDTIGDLVIFTSALAELQRAWPKARHTVVVRAGYEALAPLFPAGIEWRVARFNPFSAKPADCRAPLATLLTELESLQPDLIVAATINRTWLELAVAHRFPAARRVALGSSELDPLFAASFRLEFGAGASDSFSEFVPVEASGRDWESNHRLADQLAGRALPRSQPVVRIPAEAAQAADRVLTGHGLAGQDWIAVFPAGLANVPIKAWPAGHFAALIHWLQQERKLPVLLLGHASESEIVAQVAAGVTALGGSRPAQWLGRDGELPLLAALLGKTRLYLGHDTGAMHLAAAAGRPVASVFGGGHWPRFRPVGTQAVSVVHPLPCFGCNWDCHFGQAPCVKAIEPADVRRAVERLLAAGDGPVDEVVAAAHIPAGTQAMMAAASEQYRALQADRIERQHRIEELKGETDLKDAEIDALKGEANTKDTEIAELKKETDFKDGEIADLKRAAEERKTEMEAIKAELEAECADKDREIAELKAEADRKDAEIEGLKAVCNEREQLIFTSSGHIREFQRIVGELNAAHGEKDKHIANLQAAREAEQTTAAARQQELLARLQRLEAVYAHVPEPGNPERIAADFEAKDVHIRNIEAMLAQREAALEQFRKALGEAEGSLANVAAGFAALEGAKHYGRLLAEKEAAIQTLHTACVEREKVIRQLATEATGIGPRLARLWTATRAHVRLKFAQPLRAWIFSRVVEQYWMQIGILRHYEARPLVWDKFPKPSLPDDRLPVLGIVTPSYGQAAFVETTMRSILDQRYPRLLYVVQDGGSKDASPGIIARHADRLALWESAPDQGQADAVRKGFRHIEGRLGPQDVMAWLNSDDLIAPRTLRFVGEYFARNPEVDVVYGHRIIIDEQDREVGRWVMPRHDPRSLEWIDYVPQETLFWRKRAWDLVGGIDPSFQFALDWDLLARFTQARLRVVRLPYFLGCFRVHPSQKTSAAIHTTGAEEMGRIRTRFHGLEKQGDMETINAWARRIRFQGALAARLLGLGVRW
jgi:ADP-heptose:LPS heptosyltransferase